ncbi:MAG: glycosyltransferase [Acidobacteria bacterium]|nr:glycosyltransferase [Acidobacteriota bacterium]
MRMACFTPLPPRKSGIADYSAALLARLAERVEVEAFVEDSPAEAPGWRVRHWREYRREQFDVTLYQVGNNPDHSFLYPIALEQPGVVVLHEFNLHHLLADVTIRRGDWDGYLREVEYNGGPEAVAYARRVRALEVGPDYEKVAMNRRLLEKSRALIVHSHFMEAQVRSAGFTGPVAVIPHGTSMAEEPLRRRAARRFQLGVEETAPLIGIFGFLKPYKRIAEALRAFQRLVRVEPRARMILVGEEHPDYPVRRLISSLDLEPHVRLPGYVPLDEFEEYLAAVDICLNLRYPTVGESSGSLLRALGMGRAVVVSDVGSFAELPDDVCLKAPVGEGEVDCLFEYLNLVVSRKEVARELGERARTYVANHCTWERVAAQYAEFLQAMAEGRAQGAVWPEPARPAEPAAIPGPEAAPAPSTHAWAEYILGYASGSFQMLEYARTHLSRLVRTLEITPRGTAEDRILEMGSYLQITPALHYLLGYGEVRGCYMGPAGKVEHREAQSTSGERFSCEVDLFDAERDPFPYPDGWFATVLCCELIEHLATDPMHTMSEINRIVRPGGTLVLTTPNICSLRAIAAILLGYHPGLFPHYIRPSANGTIDPRHAREYAPREVALLLEQAGFEVTLLETGPFLAEPSAAGEWVLHLIERYQLAKDLRGEGVYAVGRKVSPVKCRYPSELYAGGEG